MAVRGGDLLQSRDEVVRELVGLGVITLTLGSTFFCGKLLANFATLTVGFICAPRIAYQGAVG